MGGGAMRTAARMAGVTVANGGLRGFVAEHSPLSSLSTRRTSPHSVDDVTFQKSSSEMDDWIFAGEEEEMSDLMPMPRVLFGKKSPSIQEATEATSELADALEKAYLSSPNFDNKACITSTSEIVVAPAVPTHAIKAFKFLHESTVAQNVVASIACDPNVWNAVLQNQELQLFLNSHRTATTAANVKEFTEESELLDESSPKSTSESSPKSTCGQFDYEEYNGYIEFVEKMKVRVVHMVSSLSDYFQNIFGGQGVNKIFVNSNGTPKVSADAAMETSFMGLAVMAIMVILLKRD